MKIGAQMYTVRQSCQTLDDFALTLKKIADIGYKTVQVSGVCPYEPQWLKEQLDKNGLECAITHPSDEAFADPAKMVADHKVYNCKYIGLGSMPKGSRGLDGFDQFLKDYLPIAQAIHDNGAYMSYHHHHYEFGRDARGERYLDRILSTFSPEILGLTLDTYWVQVGGRTPQELLRELKGRVPCIHLKDLTMNVVEQHMAPVGSGNLNFDAILSAAEDAGTEYALVEQDYCYDEDPFDCLAKSYAYLKSMGF